MGASFVVSLITIIYSIHMATMMSQIPADRSTEYVAMLGPLRVQIVFGMMSVGLLIKRMAEEGSKRARAAHLPEVERGREGDERRPRRERRQWSVKVSVKRTVRKREGRLQKLEQSRRLWGALVFGLDFT
jgi:hypothetical protein